MRSVVVSFLVYLLLCISAVAQTPSAASTPPVDDGDVVKITTALIQLDVSVTDAKGKAVTDLRPDEIEVYENGIRQKVTGFRFVSNIRSSEEFEQRKYEPNAAVLPPTSPVRVERVHRTIALVVDDLSLSYISVAHVRDALKKFVDEQMQDGDLVAIIRTGGGIGALQQFTNDRRQLHAAIERLRWNPLGAGKIGTNNFTEQKTVPRFAARLPGVGERTLQGLQREFEDNRQSVFATGTVNSLNYIVQGMGDLPGRKSIMVFSDGFRLYSEDALGWRQRSPAMDAIQKLIDVANRASVVVYTVEAVGLETNGLTAGDSTSGWSTEEVKREVADRREKLLDAQDTLTYLAKQTGGIAITNNSDLGGGIRKILDDQSYYLVGYEPEDGSFDPKAKRFNNIEIKITRPGTTARYRSGFFAVSDETKPKTAQTPGERLTAALTSPFGLNDISLKLNALFYSSPRGGAVRSLVHVRAQDLKFTDEPDGRKKVVFDVVTVAFGENGKPVDQKSETQTMTLKKDLFDQVMKTGFVYDFMFPIKKPGSYQLRVAFRDHGTNKLGSASQFVDVPDLKDARLVLSGVVLENLAYADWQRQSKGQPVQTKTDPLKDTSLRQFRRGSVLNYGFTIYNARTTGARASLGYQTRIFRDGKLIFEGKNQPVPMGADPAAVNFTSTLSLGTDMDPGDYVLQVVITDGAAGNDSNSVTQFVQFEIVD